MADSSISDYESTPGVGLSSHPGVSLEGEGREARIHTRPEQMGERYEQRTCSAGLNLPASQPRRQDTSVSHKTGMPVNFRTSYGETITLTPIWSSLDGESIDIEIDHAVSLRPDDIERLANVAETIINGYRPLWALIPEGPAARRELTNTFDEVKAQQARNATIREILNLLDMNPWDKPEAPDSACPGGRLLQDDKTTTDSYEHVASRESTGLEYGVSGEW